MLKKCVICGKDFEVDAKGTMKYILGVRKKTCSDKCHRLLRKKNCSLIRIRNKKYKKCKFCGKEFIPTRCLLQTCCKEHSILLQKVRFERYRISRQKPPVYRKCVICGTSFGTLVHNRKVCSAACKLKLKVNTAKERRFKNRKLLEKNCIICGKEFTTIYLHKKTCSEKCGKKLQKRNSRITHLKWKKSDQGKKYFRDYGKRDYVKAQRLAYTRREDRRALGRLKSKKYRQTHKEYFLSWYYKNKDKVARYKRDYVSSEKGKLRSKHQNSKRRSKLKELGPGITPEQWNQLLEKANYRCVCCGYMGKPTQDHIEPLDCGGKDTFNNSQILCKSCNSRKHNKRISLEELKKRTQVRTKPEEFFIELLD